MKCIAEYVWLDGGNTPELRSKTKIIETSTPMRVAEQFPDWQFDGSSTGQADGNTSDCILKPVKVVADPTRPQMFSAETCLVLCEVFNPDGTPHKSNTRAKLRATLNQKKSFEPWIGFEQEYTMFQDGVPAGWPQDGTPGPQGPYYCASGATKVAGRQVVEEHLNACLKSGLSIVGINAEVMLGQWEYQIGAGCPLEMSDDLWLSRYLLYKIGEKHNYEISLYPKPRSGDWNGAGMHTNYSTLEMRSNERGIEAIELACEALSEPSAIQNHLDCYGEDYELRLTGEHETCSYQEYKYGVADRTASVRIPLHVAANNYGYFEDRRPNANADPYKVSNIITETVCFNLDIGIVENQIMT